MHILILLQRTSDTTVALLNNNTLPSNATASLHRQQSCGNRADAKDGRDDHEGCVRAVFDTAIKGRVERGTAVAQVSLVILNAAAVGELVFAQVVLV